MNNHILSDLDLKAGIDYLQAMHPDGLDPYTIAQNVRGWVEKKADQLGLEGVLAESIPWQEATFSKATIDSVTTHLLREWDELRDSGFRDPAEFADVVLLMAHLAHKKFFRLEDAVRNKFEVNKKRQWAAPDSAGVSEHVRHEEEPSRFKVIDNKETLPTVKFEQPPVNFMRLDPHGNPVGLGSTQKEANVYAPPVLPHYRVVVENGQTVFEKLIFWHVNGSEHSWKTVDNIQSGSEADILIFAKLQTLVDMGCVTPIEVTVHVDPLGRLTEPTLNQRSETVIEVSNGKRTGRVGTVKRYRRGGKEFVSPPVWDANLVYEE